MSTVSYPKALYHYTSIETLALILKNKKLRFTRADKVNDLEEIMIKDLPKIKKTVFVSCWTGNEKESIPLWALYASQARGVRIKLPPNMFEGGTDPYQSVNGSCNIINLMSLENVVERGSVCQWIPYLFGPVVVDYEDDPAVSVLENKELKVERIGTVKLKHWTFEKECRFLIIPDALWNPESKRFVIHKESLAIPIEKEYIDIPLKTSTLDSVEVMLGPDAEDAERCIVESLLNQYTVHGTVKDSDLKGRIKLKEDTRGRP